jgi:hypothetical protein
MITEATETARVGRDLRGMRVLVGLSAAVFSALYLLSDVVELVQQGFSTMQLSLTYAAEAAIPLYVMGLYAVQRPRIGWLGLVSALGYAYTYIFFTGTVLYALVDRTSDWASLQARMGAWITVHGVLMVVAGFGFGLAVVRAGVLPRWTGYALVAGVGLVAITSGLPDLAQTVSAAVRDLAFVGMGVSVLRGLGRQTRRP